MIHNPPLTIGLTTLVISHLRENPIVVCLGVLGSIFLLLNQLNLFIKNVNESHSGSFAGYIKSFALAKDPNKSSFNFLEFFKITISVLLGLTCLLSGLYAPVLSALLLTEREVRFENLNYILIALGIVFLWGRIKALARAIQSKLTTKKI